MSLRLLYLIFLQLCSWLVLLGRFASVQARGTAGTAARGRRPAPEQSAILASTGITAVKIPPGALA